MTKHVYAEMIKAKADNVDLVLFIYSDGHNSWSECLEPQKLFIYQSVKFFLCLPQYKNECLHWLNGGMVEQWANTEWIALYAYSQNQKWYENSGFMDDEFKVRIKPRKEKLYIAVKTDKHERLGGCRKVRICSHAFVSKEDAESYLDLSDSQLVEIEIEI